MEEDLLFARISTLTFHPSGLGGNKSDLIAVATPAGPAHRRVPRS